MPLEVTDGADAATARKDDTMRETVPALPSAPPAYKWNWAYVAGPVAAVVMVIADTLLGIYFSDNSALITYYEVISVVGIGVVALVAACGSGKVRVGVTAAALASLVAWPLNALGEFGVFMYMINTPTPADQSDCGCGGVGGPVFGLAVFVIMGPIIYCLFRLVLTVTVGFLTAWLGVLLSWLFRGRTLSAASRRSAAV